MPANDLSENEKDSILSILDDLIAIPSVKGNPEADAPYGADTLEALRYMLNLGKANGFKTKNLQGRAGYIEWGSGAKMIGILCHLDIVPAGEGWNEDPFILRSENGRLIGRGINDDKGPAVCILYAMIRLKKSGFVPKCRIRLILGLDEECGGSDMEHYKKVEELPTLGFTPDADFPAIFAEKGILQLSLTASGSDTLIVRAGERPNMVPAHCIVEKTGTGEIIEAFGIPAHGSKPSLGVNAIHEALKKLDRETIDSVSLLRFFSEVIGDDTTGKGLLKDLPHDVSGSLTANAGVLTIDSQKSQLLLDIRYPVTASSDALLSEIRSKAAFYGIECGIYSHQLPLFKDLNDPLITTLISVYEKYLSSFTFDETVTEEEKKAFLSTPAKPLAIGGGTYARSMPGLVAFGPAFPWEKDQAHQVNESMAEDMIYLLVRVYEDAIRALTGIV